MELVFFFVLLALFVAVTASVGRRDEPLSPPREDDWRVGSPSPPRRETTRLPFTPFRAKARVIDGDTIEVRPASGGSVIRVRLQDMDAPEFDQPEGVVAAAMLRRILRSGECSVEPRGPDVYGRLVARVRRADGKDVGLCMIAAGLAIAVGRCPPIYAKVERQAREEGRGSWGRQGFVSPSDWRRGKAAR